MHPCPPGPPRAPDTPRTTVRCSAFPGPPSGPSYAFDNRSGDRAERAPPEHRYCICARSTHNHVAYLFASGPLCPGHTRTPITPGRVVAPDFRSTSTSLPRGAPAPGTTPLGARTSEARRRPALRQRNGNGTTALPGPCSPSAHERPAHSPLRPNSRTPERSWASDGEHAPEYGRGTSGGPGPGRRLNTPARNRRWPSRGRRRPPPPPRPAGSSPSSRNRRSRLRGAGKG